MAWVENTKLSKIYPLLRKKPWSIRVRLNRARALGDVVLFTLLLNSTLRLCDLFRLRIAMPVARAITGNDITAMRLAINLRVKFGGCENTHRSV